MNIENKSVYVVWRKGFNDRVDMVGIYTDKQHAEDVREEVYENSFNAWVQEVKLNEDLW